MSGITSLGDFVGLSLVWVLPAFWMVLYSVKTKRLDFLVIFQVLIAAILLVFEVYPPTQNAVVTLFPSWRLLTTYYVLCAVFTWILVVKYGWHYPQAISISALVAFVGSYYWEAPYLIRNAFITGPQWDWGLHLLVIFPIWFLTITVGWTRRLGGYGRWLLFLAGLAIAAAFMVFNPVPYGVTSTDVWDSAYYLADRAIACVIVFLLVNKEVRM